MSRSSPYQLLEQWEATAVAQDMAPGTLRCYRGQIRQFIDATGPAQALAAGQDELLAHLARLREAKRSHSTVNGHFAALASFYGFLEYAGHVEVDPVPKFRKFHLKGTRRKMKRQRQRRQSILPDRAARFVASIPDVQERAIALLLFKTGIRREELVGIDLGDINWQRLEIEMDLHPKRSQGTVCFDDEMARLLHRWTKIRRLHAEPGQQALFLSSTGTRLGGNRVYERFVEAAEVDGLHDRNGPLHQKFTPHCARHCFTRWLRAGGMPDHVIAHLRGDAESTMVDVYDRMDPDDVAASYRRHMPRLGVA